MRDIGGYFELADCGEGVFPHKDGLLLNTGRNALEYILRSIGNVKGIYLPYYTCEVVLEPLKKLDIPWSFYHVNSRFEVAEGLHPKEGEYVIANNYFGIKDAYILELAKRYGDSLIVDCAQALFAKPIPGIKTIYSTRKFVGVADGGVAYLGNSAGVHVDIAEMERTADHDSHLYLRKQFGAEAGFAEFQENERKLIYQPIRRMSDTTRKILDSIDYERIIERRRENYQYLHNGLAELNYLALPEIDSFVCPMVYPFVSRADQGIRKKLIDNKVFVAKYWPNVHFSGQFEFESELAERMIPLPIDQRYGKVEMDRINELLKQ